MPRIRKCYVCSDKQVNQLLTLFAFPVKNDTRCQTWINALHLNCDTSTMRNEYVCHKHFSPDSFHSRMYPDQRLTLHSDAVPTFKQVCCYFM